ncbi:hypothetical protein ACFFTN_13225 [Aminobacter aganoensis]|uniref:PemK-like, MazF-like toxin of type II toxin-antitoxin system n=1 Tax=Aminobacter aganoensis TaxID=83264 RepID=A0A7X0KM38_9HYPH|nr:hypothetical protein [Aminobacter aganoensis]MBB6355726.1 hypothetical protein [Aminobacter aganoensis]
MSVEFLPGQVIDYPYLWAWQHERGETEGRKVRPSCVIVAIRGAKDGLTHLALLAITTQPPQAGRVSIEVSDIECRRAGLSNIRRCWIVADEYNYDIAERSFHLEPHSKIHGRFSKAFVMKIATAFIEAQASGRRVSRLD